MKRFDVQKSDFVFFVLSPFSAQGQRKMVRNIFSFFSSASCYAFFGAAVSEAINKDKENAVKKSDKNKSIPKR